MLDERPAERESLTTFAGATIPLPDGAAGRTTEGFYDVIPTRFGQVNNYVTLARTFGDQSSVVNRQSSIHRMWMIPRRRASPSAAVRSWTLNF